MVLLSVFSWLALDLASSGIYGVVSNLTRTKETGVRVAPGASPGSIIRMILGQGMGMATIGVAVGVAAAIGLTRLMTKMLYGVSETDALTYVCVAVFLTGIASLACYFPARRALRVDPVEALRHE